MVKCVLVVFVLVASGSCVTGPPVNFYTLDMRPYLPEGQSPDVAVGEVDVEETVSRGELMIRRRTGEIEYLSNHFWAADPGALVREKLKTEFGASALGEPAWEISGTLLAFEQYGVGPDMEGRVRVKLRVRPWDGRGEVLFEQHYEARTTPVSPSPGDVARALSRSVEAIARDVAKDVAELEKSL